MTVKRWLLPKEDKPLATIIAKECDTTEFVASILVGRGKTSTSEAMTILSTDMEISSPYELLDISVAIDRIRQAIDSGEKIAVYGDYDCDGITATTMLYSYLCSVGGNAICEIPERDGDGYGLSLDAIDTLAKSGVTLIITVDNGITAVTEVDYANSKGIDIVITDHHQQADTLPEALAIINPNRRDDKSAFKGLCGAGVALKLIIALEEDLQYALENYADLVAAGTIGDIVPLIGENRALVKYGLDMLPVSENIGLNALIKVSGLDSKTISAQDIAFSVVPRINAAGRMGKARLALDLLLCEDEDEATELATELDQLNTNRKLAEKEALLVADSLIKTDKTLLSNNVLILKSDKFSHGLVGVLCSRLVERYGKPVMLLCPDGDELRGSARSFGEFHLFKALTSTAQLLTRFGGHKNAAGFSISEQNYSKFCNKIEQFAKQSFSTMPAMEIAVDKLLTAQDLTIDNVDSLDRLKPYGNLNEEPRFALLDAVIKEIVPIGGGKHLKLILDANGKVPVLLFGITEQDFPYKIEQRIDVLVSVEINTYNNNRSVSVKAKDIRLSSFKAVESDFFKSKAIYDKLQKGEVLSKSILETAIPTKSDIALIHKALIKWQGFNGNVEELFMRFISTGISYCKLRVALDILSEFSIISILGVESNLVVHDIKEKIDLNNATLLKRLDITI